MDSESTAVSDEEDPKVDEGIGCFDGDGDDIFDVRDQVGSRHESVFQNMFDQRSKL
jgi:hypothetical protein